MRLFWMTRRMGRLPQWYIAAMQVLAALLHCGHQQTRVEIQAELVKLLDKPLEEWSNRLVGAVDAD